MPFDIGIQPVLLPENSKTHLKVIFSWKNNSDKPGLLYDVSKRDDLV